MAMPGNMGSFEHFGAAESAKPKLHSVPVLHNPTYKEFHDKYYRQHKPVVLAGVVSEWPAFKKWTDDHLCEVVGTTEVEVDVSPNDFFPDTGELRQGNATRKEKMSMERFIRNVCDQSREKMYLQHQDVDEAFPALRDDVIVPPLFTGRLLQSVNLWCGGGGHSGQLHFDSYSNFLCQMSGSKRVTLFAPAEFGKMYPFDGPRKNMSQVNVDRPDHEKFPRFAQARRYEVMLHPGQALFMPVWWWHQVTAGSPGTRNLSINLWWTPSICILCKNKFTENPLMITTCKHTFCEECLRPRLKEKLECPVDHEPCTFRQVDVNVAYDLQLYPDSGGSSGFFH